MHKQGSYKRARKPIQAVLPTIRLALATVRRNQCISFDVICHLHFEMKDSKTLLPLCHAPLLFWCFIEGLSAWGLKGHHHTVSNVLFCNRLQRRHLEFHQITSQLSLCTTAGFDQNSNVDPSMSEENLRRRKSLEYQKWDIQCDLKMLMSSLFALDVFLYGTSFACSLYFQLLYLFPRITVSLALIKDRIEEHVLEAKLIFFIEKSHHGHDHVTMIGIEPFCGLVSWRKLSSDRMEVHVLV